MALWKGPGVGAVGFEADTFLNAAPQMLLSKHLGTLCPEPLAVPVVGCLVLLWVEMT